MRPLVGYAPRPDATRALVRAFARRRRVSSTHTYNEAVSMLKKVVWHIELTLLRRRMRGLHDGAPPHDSELTRSTGFAELSTGFAGLDREPTAFSDLQ